MKNKEKKLREVKDRLLVLARKLTSDRIPYFPPLREDQMTIMKEKNKHGYSLLKEYLSLEKIEKELEMEDGEDTK